MEILSTFTHHSTLNNNDSSFIIWAGRADDITTTFHSNEHPGQKCFAFFSIYCPASLTPLPQQQEAAAQVIVGKAGAADCWEISALDVCWSGLQKVNTLRGGRGVNTAAALRTAVEANLMNVWPPQTHRIPESLTSPATAWPASPPALRTHLISADPSGALFIPENPPIISPNHSPSPHQPLKTGYSRPAWHARGKHQFQSS